jgi:glycosyltransferase involved in cell wall biosynthesis
VRILYLCSDLGIPVLGQKGAAVHVRAMVAAFHRAGHSVVLAAPCLNKAPLEKPAKIDATLSLLPPDRDVTTAFHAFKAFNETLGVTNSLPGELRTVLYNQALSLELSHRFGDAHPDFIYERASLYGIAGAVLARQLRRPRIVELNAPLALEHSTYRGTGLGELAAQAERWTLLQADTILTVSAPLRDHVLSLGVEPRRVRVLPNGVDRELFHPGPPDGEVRRRLKLGDGPVLGFVGGLRPWHGVEALPALLEQLVPRYPNLRLVIAGNGPVRARLEHDLRCRGLSGSAVFADWVAHEDVAALIRQFDVALAPYSQTDHLWYFSPLKLFEYMACGTAVVAADVGQIAEVIRPGETGVLYPPGEIDALIAACDQLLADPALRCHIGQAAAREIHSKYTWDHNAACVLELAPSLISVSQAH